MKQRELELENFKKGAGGEEEAKADRINKGLVALNLVPSKEEIEKENNAKRTAKMKELRD